MLKQYRDHSQDPTVEDYYDLATYDSAAAERAGAVVSVPREYISKYLK